jgi:hypothetical protein
MIIDENIKQNLAFIKNRSDMLKSIEEEKMKMENDNIGMRLEMK